MSTPETRRLHLDDLCEIEALARARKMSLAPDVVERTLRLTEGFAPKTRPSMLVDLQAERRLELEATTGTEVRYGQEAGAAAPVHHVVYAALKPSADRRKACLTREEAETEIEMEQSGENPKRGDWGTID